MPIGTSNGEYFEDAFDQAHTEMFGAKGTYDPKTDTFVADTEPTPKEIYFVRHGDTDLNKEGEKSDDRAPVRGWNNTPLNEQGKADAQKAADKLAKEPITHIVTSDLPRASDTAKIIGDRLGITPEEHPGLRTWNLGEYTGKTGEEVHDAVDRLCLNQPDVRPPGGESFNEFKSRILSTFGEIAKDHAEHEVLVVSHNSPERILNSWDKAGQPASGEIDRKQYHSDDGSINPGEHKKFTIKDPDSLRPMTNETGWQVEPSFEERWSGTSQLLREPLPSPLDVTHGKDIVPGWLRTITPKPSEQFGEQVGPKKREPTRPSNPNLDLGPTSPFPMYGPENTILPYNPDAPGYYNYRVADIENSIESLAQKHGVEGSKLRDIITDIAKHPTDYISPMPGEMGIMSKIPIGKEILQTMRDKGMANHEIAKELGVSVRTVINRFKEFGISKEGSPIQKKQKLTPRDPNYTTNIPDWFLEEMNDKEDKAIREWMKNQFEGGPTEPEMIDSMKKYLIDKDSTQFRRAANENKNLQINPTPYEEAQLDQSWKNLQKKADQAAREEFGFNFAKTLKKIVADKDKLNKFSDILKEEIEKYSSERRAKEAIKKRKNFKIVPPEEE